ncbi:MAG: glycosyltransferase family 4 protein [Cyclobacteriaceae bacterium]|nr:glycosyltransferase family 4 protein [Cyclobacteriaceae bacterium]
MRPLKIGIEAQRIFRQKKHGMEVVAIEIIRALQDIDIQNQYYIFTKDAFDPGLFPDVKINFHFVQIDSWFYGSWEQYHLPKIASKYQLDVIHFTSNTGPLFCKIPKVLTLHDIIYLEKFTLSGTPYQVFGNFYRRFVVPAFYKKCVRVFTVSHYEKEKIEKHFKSESDDKVEVVYNAVHPRFGIDDDYISPESQVIHQLPKDYILVFGNTAPKKNTSRFLKAYCKYADSHPEPRPLVITDVDESYLEKLLREFSYFKIRNKIHVIGYISQASMPELYRRALFYVYPSVRESFGLPILESMLAGTPVITSNVTAMPEIAGDAAFLIDPFSEKSMQDALALLTSDGELRGKLITAGKNRAQHFTWQNTAQKVLEAYKKIATV